MVNVCLFITSWTIGLMNNHYEWFDQTGDIVLTFIGAISGILTIRWLLIRTKGVKQQSILDKEESELQIEIHKLELEKFREDK